MPFLRRTGPSGEFKKKKPCCWWSAGRTCKAVARKRLGHFPASSREEQIASALHDHTGDWAERGLCLPTGGARMARLGCIGWHVVRCSWTGMAWEAALFSLQALSCCLSNFLCSGMQLWELWCHPVLRAGGFLSLWWVSQKENTEIKKEKGSNIPVLFTCTACLMQIHDAFP